MQAVTEADGRGLTRGEAVMILTDLASELRGGTDPLGYDTSVPLEEFARKMAEDALSGRNRVAVEEELPRFRRRHCIKTGS